MLLGYLLEDTVGVVRTALEKALTAELASDSNLLLLRRIYPKATTRPGGKRGSVGSIWCNFVQLAALLKDGRLSITPEPYGRILVPIDGHVSCEYLQGEWKREWKEPESRSLVPNLDIDPGDCLRAILLEQADKKLPPLNEDILFSSCGYALIWTEDKIREILLNGTGIIPFPGGYPFGLSTFIEMLKVLRGDDDPFLKELREKEGELQRLWNDALGKLGNIKKYPIPEIVSAILDIERISPALGKEIPQNLPKKDDPLEKFSL